MPGRAMNAQAGRPAPDTEQGGQRLAGANSADPVLGGQITAHCRAHNSEDRGGPAGAQADTDGQVRAWMTVVTYLLLQPEMLQR